jgi:hypothetical protein
MSKTEKIESLRPHLLPIMNKLIIANATQYGGNATTSSVDGLQASSLSSLGPVLMQMVRKREERMKSEKTSGGVRAIGQQEWLTMGMDLYQKRDTAKESSINAVCDTCASYALYVLDGIIGFKGTFELFKNPSPTHHHFVVVDRAPKSTAADCASWGADCFVIDQWYARGWVPENKDGIFANPGDHLYSTSEYDHESEYSWTKT